MDYFSINKKYLLYIDILGFSELVQDGYQKVDELYNVINDINAHQHIAFHVICFSDTLLVYNVLDPLNERDDKYIVGFMIEFVRDLMYRLAELEINFRAIIVNDEFKHYYHNRIECYYGSALVKCYNLEKQINGMGLFIDKDIANLVVAPKLCYDEKLYFVSLLVSIPALLLYFPNFGNSILEKHQIDDSDEFIPIKVEMKILKQLHEGSLGKQNPKVRSKYLQTYQFYKILYNDLLSHLEKSNFDLLSISKDADWLSKSDY